MIGKSLVVSLGLAAFLTVGASSSGQAQASHACQDAIADYLESLKIDAEDVTTLNVYAVKQNLGQPMRYNAWVSMKACRGNLIINLSLNCRFDDAYSRGDCKFENVKQR
ncbi:MAG: hypothetical protein V3W34_16875 [Phycisphaerae bacterium]